MAKIVQGILGGFSGKVGTVVGSIVRGVAIMRAYVAHIGGTPTELQTEQRAKFSLVVKFMNQFTLVLRTGFRSLAKGQSAFNAAVQYNFDKIVTGSPSNWSVDYTKAVFAQGKVPMAINAELASTTAGEIDLTWDDNSTEPGAAATDKAILILYNPGTGQAIANQAGPARSTGSATIVVPSSWSGAQVHAYQSFIKAKGSDVADSVYVGSVLVA